VSFYRVSVLDHKDAIAVTRTASDLDHTAQLLVGLGACTSDAWAKPLLDEYGELTVQVLGAEDRPLEPSETSRLLELVRELGGITPDNDDHVGRLRWRNPERQT
jgi:hypothetical protein